MTPVPVGGSAGIRSLDPSSCWVRHVVRGEEGDPSAIAMARVFFVRDDTEDINGRQGWQQAQVTLVLSDDGSFQLALPNSAGDDGVLHRKRFRILTADDFEVGEEWLEFYRDPNDLIFVGAPTNAEKTTSTVTIKGADLNVVLAGSLSSEVDVWDAAAPADVFEHYSRLAVLAYGADLQATQTGGVGAWSAGYTQALTGVASDCWIVEARLRWTSARPSEAGKSQVRLKVAGLTLLVDLFEGAVSLEGAPERPVSGKRQGLTVPGPVDLRIVARYDRIFAFVAGELVAEFRRLPAWPAVPEVKAYAFGGTVAIDGLHVETLTDFAGRGTSAVFERKLPGIPPATGLRGQYSNAAPQYAQNETRDGRLARLWALLGEEPAVDRVDPTVNFTVLTTGGAPNLPGAFAARWSGAIYLDLATGDRNIRIKGVKGNARVYVGRTLRDDPAASTWAVAEAAELTTESLRTWLGTSEAGWYPIVVELAHGAAELRVILEDRAGSGSYAVVPQSRLSPIGCYSDLVRFSSHRQVIGEVALAFGYQWRVEHRSMESGEFPGQYAFKSLIGRQTEVVIDDDAVGTEAQVSVAAGDVVDGMVVDAAGLADPSGSGQLSAQVIDYGRASNHLALRQVYDSLSEISEEPLLRTRIDSLLALRSSPNEQVGVRPRGQRDLVDTFPLTGVLARMDWQPGDAARLKLDSIDVVDQSPRQLTTVAWPLRPDGVGSPTVGFRQRPRSIRAALKRLSALLYAPRRNYQGTAAVVTGSLGGATSAGGAVAGASDAYSRAPLPANLNSVTKVVAVVQSLEGSGWRLEVAGVDLSTAGAVSSAGRYDITDAARAAALGAPQIYARLIGGGSGSYLLALEVWITA